MKERRIDMKLNLILSATLLSVGMASGSFAVMHEDHQNGGHSSHPDRVIVGPPDRVDVGPPDDRVRIAPGTGQQVPPPDRLP